MEQPSWLGHAWGELGQKERAGPADNARILQFYRDVGAEAIAHDEVAWCAAFAGACLERAGAASTRSLMARSYLKWGGPLAEGQLGALAVLSRGSDPALGHVGFLIGETSETLILLGGNQSDAVTVAEFAKSRLVGFRWPAAATAVAMDVDFEAALGHVLEMEGGYGDDPYDPGGATNFGITLGVFASWKGVAADASLKDELKRIAPETVREIYRARYWAPALCPTLPVPIAFLHFDAAVNHGVGTAARCLQEAVGAEIDGEIGPATRARLAIVPIADVLARYAEIRRRRYRALPHFWRFGRGWLARVDRTLARASALQGEPAVSSTSLSEGDQDMANEDTNPATPKWWGQSMTIWGAIITTMATVLPAFGPIVGIEITGDLVHTAGDQIVTLAQAIAGLAGTIMTIYGRARAAQPLERRVLSLKV